MTAQNSSFSSAPSSSSGVSSRASLVQDGRRAGGDRTPLDRRLQDLFLRLNTGLSDAASGVASAPNSVELEIALRWLLAAGELGHLCLDLENPPAADELPAPPGLAPGEGRARLIEERAWLKGADCRESLSACPLVMRPGDDVLRPLVLDAAARRLYLHRLWRFESALIARLRDLVSAPPRRPPDLDAVRQALSELFRTSSYAREPDFQKLAAALALLRRFLVVSGGPGVGKTSTVVRILALLQRFRPGLRIALAAPTGKAAQRLSDSIRQALAALPHWVDPESGRTCSYAEGLPDQVQTLHRLLGQNRLTGAYRRNAGHPLPIDLLVIDEASMADLSLLAHTLEALPPEADLILLGDPGQLASVEAGAVLGDLCAAGEGLSEQVRVLTKELLGPESDAWLKGEGSGVPDSIVELKRNYRFGADSGIAAFARAVNAGDGEGALGVLKDDAFPDAKLLRPAELDALIVDSYSPYLQAQDPEEALARLDEFRLLAALRRGPGGVEALNLLAERRLRKAGLIPVAPAGGLYAGLPVLILRNDYSLDLFNGDVGVIRDEGAGLVAWFRSAEGLRRVPASLLPPHEPCFAMTVHKSQGSEFRTAALVLPEQDTPVLTRELIYTAATRARERVIVLTPEATLTRSCDRQVLRSSGLSAAFPPPGPRAAPARAPTSRGKRLDPNQPGLF